MARKRQEEEHENHERWLVSYADFITLLFAFFVVMYAVSSLNEGKYRVASESITSAFRTSPSTEASTASGAMAVVNPNAALTASIPSKRVPNVKAEAVQKEKKERLKNVAKDLNQALAPLVQEGKVKVTEGALGITVDINASLLFASGDARLDIGAIRSLAAIGQILAPTDFPIIVEGHTDNTPISTPQFPSNWELSGVRASSVVRLFIETGVNAARLTATGYADQRPVADNATPEGRQSNRRVAITIESRNPDNAVEVSLPQ
jgi:chemotaxis protein MotB